MVRSDKSADMESRCEELARDGQKYGFMPLPIAEDDRMEPWEPVDSELARLAMELGKDIFETKPILRTVHAGLESGIIQLKNNGMEAAISIGALIKYPHSTGERVEIASVGRNYQLLSSMLERL